MLFGNFNLDELKKFVFFFDKNFKSDRVRERRLIEMYLAKFEDREMLITHEVTVRATIKRGSSKDFKYYFLRYSFF